MDLKDKPCPHCKTQTLAKVKFKHRKRWYNELECFTCYWHGETIPYSTDETECAIKLCEDNKLRDLHSPGGDPKWD